MSKGKMTQFLHDDDATICYIEGKGALAMGIAYFNPEGCEKKPSTLVGETIAYHKALKEYYQQLIERQESKVKTLKDFGVYLFPDRFQGRQIDWIKQRYEKKIAEEIKKLAELKQAKEDAKKYLQDYVDGRKFFLEKLSKKRAQQHAIEESTTPKN